MNKPSFSLSLLLVSACAAVLVPPLKAADPARAPLSAVPAEQPAAVFDPIIADMIAQVGEREIHDTAAALQGFTSRAWGQPGNVKAAAYLHERLGQIAGLTVGYQGGELKNVVATLQGMDPQSADVYVVGAHYDSMAAGDAIQAPGATDNAAGVGVVLEYARVMSLYRFRHTLVFACWNREETGMQGSANWVDQALSRSVNVRLYINNDSCCFDPDGRYVLDLIFNSQSAAIGNMMAGNVALYKIGFLKLTDNLHKCGGDYSPFWKKNLTAVSTHQEVHGAHYHTARDTVERVNTRYARMNAQVGMSVIARLAQHQPVASADSQTPPSRP